MADPHRLLARALRWEAPPCLPPVRCTGGPCRCQPAEHFGRAADQRDSPALTTAEASTLRVFFFDGHSGPLNDMTSTLARMNVTHMDAMLMAQAAEKRPFVELFRMPSVVHTFPLRLRAQMHDFLRGSVHRKTDAVELPKCERKRCRVALYSEGLRREFARRFGAALEASIDVVALLPDLAVPSSSPSISLHLLSISLHLPPSPYVHAGRVQLPDLAVRHVHARQRGHRDALHPSVGSPPP